MDAPLEGLGERTVAQMLAFSEKLAAGAVELKRLEASPEGCTEFERCLSFEGTALRRYRPLNGPRDATPIVVVYALVNRPYMLDLEPERSFIRGLLEGGRDVYLVDWGYPRPEHRSRTLDDYAVRHLDACLDAVTALHGTSRIDLLGVCQGGTMSLCHAALRPERIRTLTLMVTPVDFASEDFLLARWIRYVDVDSMVERLGNVPGAFLNWAFLGLKPLSLSSLKAIDLIELMDRPHELATFARMEHWLQDSPDQAGRAFAQFVRTFFHDNALVSGTLTLGGERVRLDRIACPVLNIYASNDHIVPPSATTPLSGLIEPDLYAERAFAGGHIGIFASRRGRREVPSAINRWLDAQTRSAASR